MTICFLIATLCMIAAFLFEWGMIAALVIYPILFVWLYVYRVFYPHLCLFIHKYEQNESRANFYMVRVGLLILALGTVLLCVFIPNKFVLVLCFYAAFLLVVYVYPALRYVLRRSKFYKALKEACKEKGYHVKSSFRRFLFGTKPNVYIETPSQTFAIHTMDSLYPIARIRFENETAYTVQKVNPILAEQIDRLEQQIRESSSTFASYMCIGHKRKRRISPVRDCTNICVFSSTIMWRNLSCEVHLKNGDTCCGYVFYDESAFISSI